MPGYHAGQDDAVRRLRRIEGRVRGLQRMVEEDAYCISIRTRRRHRLRAPVPRPGPA